MKDLSKLTTKQVLVIRERDQIQKEIKSHGRSWCDAWCNTFDPVLYRQLRLSGHTAKHLQDNPDLCHRRD